MTDQTYKYCPLCSSKLTEKQIDGETRLACSDEKCSYVFWNNPLPVVAAIVEYEGKILLARNALWPPKIFALITGFLEKGETAEEGILREVKEELNLDASIEEFIGAYSFIQNNQLILVYHVKAKGEIALSAELVEYKLVEINKLRPWPQGTGPAVKDWLKKQKTD